MEVALRIEEHESRTAVQQPDVFYRITALWALSEAFLGGILHVMHLPGTGLFVGGAAVLCISLLASQCPGKGAVLKATVLVILVKGILSPHTPPGAYLAVFIQGGLGYLLFLSKQHFKLSCLALGVLTQLQSALQRLVIMLFMFGADLYQVAHGFVNYILKKAGFEEGNYVLFIVIAYLALHLVMGIIVGWFAGRLPVLLQKKKQQSSFSFEATQVPALQPASSSKKNNYLKRLFPVVLLAVVLLLSISLYLGLISDNTVYTIFIRALLISILWVWVLSPLLQRLVTRWSNKKRVVLASELNQVLQLMPFIYKEAKLCWASTSLLLFHKRLIVFPLRLLGRLI